jgi:hypothetical protein
MATNTGTGSRKGAVKKRTQVKNSKTGVFAKRNEDPKSKHDGEFMDNRSGRKPFKGVAKEPDKRRKAR